MKGVGIALGLLVALGIVAGAGYAGAVQALRHPDFTTPTTAYVLGAIVFAVFVIVITLSQLHRSKKENDHEQL
ncbi:MAG TPA: hypothetical protein VFL85_04780 [Candidatus Saccharimonadales bacterium]|nr:hypothetical protein [Candidatus Saccharimonadales bacterium]